MKTTRWMLALALMVAACGGDDEMAVPEGETCGGLLSKPCQEGLYCDYPDTAACGIADGTGSCRARPDFCTPIILEVCGCDGRRYHSACDAHRAGTDDNPRGNCL